MSAKGSRWSKSGARSPGDNPPAAGPAQAVGDGLLGVDRRGAGRQVVDDQVERRVGLDRRTSRPTRAFPWEYLRLKSGGGRSSGPRSRTQLVEVAPESRPVAVSLAEGVLDQVRSPALAPEGSPQAHDRRPREDSRPRSCRGGCPGTRRARPRGGLPPAGPSPGLIPTSAEDPSHSHRLPPSLTRSRKPSPRSPDKVSPDYTGNIDSPISRSSP